MLCAKGLTAALLTLVLAGAAAPAQAETSKVRIGLQFGLTYLPIMVAHSERMIEKHAKAQGLPEVEVTLQREAELEQFFGQGYRALSVMERHLSDREFFVGERPTVADVALYVYPSVAHEGGFDLESYAAVRAWLERVAALPGYVPLKPPS